jgi:hypothetical protein
MNNDGFMIASDRWAGCFYSGVVAFIVCFAALFSLRCEKSPATSNLGEKFIDSQTDLSLIDTYTVNLSTVILDTFVNAGTGTLLVGNYRDAVLGKITSASYFEIGIPDEFDVQNDDIYDSLQLVIQYNKYSCGDTTKSQKIVVHQLTENIKFQDTDINAGGISFAYDPDPIGSTVYIPQPHRSTDTIAITLSDRIGRDLFSKLKEGSTVVSDADNFIDYFHGLVLTADDAYEGSIIGFTAGAEAVKLLLFTSRAGLTFEQIVYEFKLENTDQQFNHITHDFSPTSFNPLVKQRNELSSVKTGDLSYIQGGIGLVLRVDFPALDELLLRGRGKIVEAQLTLAPQVNSYDDFTLPADLVMYGSNKSNSVLVDQGQIAASTLTVDELYNEKTYYSFDITDYLNDELADSYVDPEKGLIITLPSDSLKTSFSRLAVAAQNKNTKLKIYYLSY